MINIEVNNQNYILNARQKSTSMAKHEWSLKQNKLNFLEWSMIMLQNQKRLPTNNHRMLLFQFSNTKLFFKNTNDVTKFEVIIIACCDWHYYSNALTAVNYRLILFLKLFYIRTAAVLIQKYTCIWKIGHPAAAAGRPIFVLCSIILVPLYSLSLLLSKVVTSSTTFV